MRCRSQAADLHEIFEQLWGNISRFSSSSGGGTDKQSQLKGSLNIILKSDMILSLCIF
jgi:hypothetical protein